MDTVSNWMTRQPHTIEGEASALAALELMIERDVRHLPVLDRAGRLRGVLSFADLRAALPASVTLRQPPGIGDREDVEGYTVGELMTHGPLTVPPELTMGEAAACLARFRIGCLPVVDGEGRLVGILSETDALRALACPDGPSRGIPTERSAELELVVAELRSERGRIADQLARLQATERESATERGAAPAESDAQARQLGALAVDEPLAALSARRLDGIDHALARAQRGDLGRCEKCGWDIPIARLRALPGSTRCVRCASGAA